MDPTWTESWSGLPIGENEPTSTKWGKPALPSWVREFRPSQIEAVTQILEHYASGKKLVILEAPTGTGKTLIAEMVRRLIARRGLYVCTTKTLQDQFAHDFPYAINIKGRDNYPTEQGPHWVSAADCTWPGPDEDAPMCQWCSHKPNCPYEQVKAEALDDRNPLVVANTAYFLTEANYVGRFSCWDGSRTTHKPWGLAIVDEADTLEDEVMGHVEFRLGKRIVGDLGIELPDRKTLKAAVKSDSWVRWANNEGIPKLRKAVNESRIAYERSETLTDLRRLRARERKLDQLVAIRNDLGEGWVLTGYKEGGITFKPIRVDHIGKQLIWQHAPRWLLMSATVVSATQMAHDLGIEEGSWASVVVGSGFDSSRRPIIVDSGSVSLTNSNRRESWPKVAERIRKILNKYPDQRVLIHTVSYKLANYLADQLDDLPRPILVYRMAKERQVVLEDFRNLRGSVLIAPSLDRGVDLPDDLARVIIVAKVPWPNIGDQQISARLYSPGGRTWYSVKAIRSIVQMTGRGMRHKDDWADSWIVDRQFVERIWREHKDLLPRWWKDAVVWHSDVFPPIEKRIEELEGNGET